MTIYQPTLLLRRLVSLRKHVPRLDCGICSNANLVFYSDTMDTFFVGWPEYSGDPVYPVKGGLGAYDYENATNKWDKGTEYGQARYRLLEHIISVVEAYIEENPDA